MGAKYFGASVRRKEDPRYLRGEGRFVDDIKLPGMLHAAFVRSPHAHARIAAIRTDAAKRLPGVAHVFTFADLERWMKPLPLFGAIPPGLSARVAVTMKQIGQLALCRDETRGVVAQWDARDGTLTTWNGTQVVHFVQQGLVSALGLPPHKIRVIAPDVGGGFGTKANGYAEDLLIPAAAIASRRPVKWTEDRREHMMGSAHARAQVHDNEIAARRDGTMLAVRDRIWVDLGAYNSWGIVLPYNTVAHLLGPHRVANLDVECLGVVTTKTPNAPYRGAGRPETVFAMDRIVDCLARELAMDPAELRRKNYLAAADLPYEIDLPYRDGNPLVYDSGDFRAGLEAALGTVDYEALRREQAELRARGIHRGIGL